MIPMETTDWETKQLKKLEAADDHHKYYSSHQAVESVGNANISAKEFSDSISRSHSSALTATLTQSTHMINASRNIPETYELKSCSTTTSTTSKFKGIQQYKVEPMDGDILSVNDDVVFWYNFLMKAGELDREHIA